MGGKESNKWGCVVLRKVLSVLMAACMAIPAVPVHAAEPEGQKVVRVGYYADNGGFQLGFSDEERKSGYAYEYYQDIAAHTGWKYEYVYGSWGEIYEKLLSGDVDIMAGISRTEERMGLVLYPDNIMGTESYYIFVPEDSDSITGKDITTLNGKRIGVNKDSLMMSLFEQYIEDNSLNCEIKTFDSAASSGEALEKGEIDGYIVTDNFDVEGVKPVIKIGASDIYFAINKERPDLLGEINEAQEEINADSPHYIMELQEKYFEKSILRQTLNEEEREWLAGRQEIRIGYLDDFLPLSGVDKKTGEISGVFSELLPEFEEFSGVEVVPVPYGNLDDMTRSMKEGEIDAAFPLYSDIWYSERAGICQTESFVYERVVVLSKKPYGEEIFDKMAISKTGVGQYYYIKTYYPDAEIVQYDDVHDCLDAVRAGEASCMIGSGSVLQRFLNENEEYEGLYSAFLDHSQEFSIAVNNDETLLNSIFNKAIRRLDRAEITDAQIRYSEVEPDYTVIDFLRHNLVLVIGLLLLVVALVLIVFYVYRKKTRRNQQKLQRAVQEANRANETLTNYKEQTCELLEGARTGLWTIETEEGELPRMFADKTMCMLVGVPEDASPEECYAVWKSNVDEEYAEALNKYVEMIIETGRAEISYPYHHPLLGLIHIRCGGVPDRAYTKNGIRIRGYHQDITRVTVTRHKLEEEKRQQEEVISALCRDYICIYNVNLDKDELRILRATQKDKWLTQSYVCETHSFKQAFLNYVNRAVWSEDRERFRQMTRPEYLRKRLAYENAYSFRYRVDIGQNPTYYEVRIVRGNDTEEGMCAIIAIRGVDSEVKHEMEYQDRLAKAAAEAERANRAKTDFLSRMSHDIRTPINGIMGMLEIVRRNRSDEERVEDCLGKIEMSAGYLLTLINDVLDMSKLESGKVVFAEEPFDIRELLRDIDDIIYPMAAETGIAVEGHDNGKIANPYILGSPLHVRQILLNLASNAVKYNRPGGKVAMDVEETVVSEGMVEFCFIISDTGIGMSEEFCRHLFEPFSQEQQTARTKYKGSGLGLSIVKRLVDQMGGEITVHSEQGVGSRFAVTLPFKIDPSPQLEKEEQAAERICLDGVKILLVEDNAINREIAQFLLEEAGAVLDAAEDGQRAVDKFKASAQGEYAVILMDVMMPVMDGLTASRTIRGLDRPDAGTIPIIAMTANAFAEDAAKCKEAGMDEHISKPVDGNKLLSVIAKYVK